ncbi:MAG TPA: hypothetical protein VH482_37860 [Thermomicrobiales bacterium]|jgi:hypothetical protein
MNGIRTSALLAASVAIATVVLAAPWSRSTAQEEDLHPAVYDLQTRVAVLETQTAGGSVATIGSVLHLDMNAAFNPDSGGYTCDQVPPFTSHLELLNESRIVVGSVDGSIGQMQGFCLAHYQADLSLEPVMDFGRRR